MIICCYYTVDTDYVKCHAELIKSARKHANKFKIVSVPISSKGSWVSNCAMKPEIIRDVMLDNPDEDILYVDVDAKFNRRFVVPSFTETLGIFRRKVSGELLSGTIFIKNNEEGMKIVNDWLDYQRANPKIIDQVALRDSLLINKIKYYNIGQEYCHVFDWKSTGKPYIVHYQESRKNRRIVTMKHADIPHAIEGARIIHNIDGSVSLARRNKKAEEYLDRNFIKLKNELTWVKALPSQMKAADLGDIDYGYVVGKGQSLDYLTEKDFPNKEAPILAVNEAIFKLNELDLENPIYLIAQDAHFKDTLGVGKSGALISKSLMNFYDQDKGDNLMAFSPTGLLPRGMMNITVNIATTILKQCGAKALGLVSFDGAALGDLKYAEVSKTPIERGGNPRRFLEQKVRIVACCKGTPIEWITPCEQDQDKFYGTDLPSTQEADSQE